MRRTRSVLFSPATETGRVTRLLQSEADVIVLDLEDAVPVQLKERARHDAVELAGALLDKRTTLQVFVRVNAIRSPWFEEDVSLAGTSGISGVVVPKVETPEDLAVLRDLQIRRPELMLLAQAVQ